ncbi:MAG: HAMP domain-containing histidine kinase, partial [Duncaniella sp.]|nr:HAMP domain-containing histidine kinase [Duncaniella sp.]
MTRKTTVIGAIIWLFVLPVIAYAVPSETVYYRQLQQDLEKAPFADDSIAILNNMFDLIVQPRSLRNSIGSQLIDVADRNGLPATSYDAIRRLVNYNSGDEAYMDSMLAVTEKYPESADRDITVAFITMMRNNSSLKSLNDSVKTRYISELAKDFSENPPLSVLDRIVKLHSLCLLLGDSYQSELVGKYMQRLGALVDGLPDEAMPIKNLYYVQAALTFLQCDMRKEAVAADEKLLQIIGELETNYKLQGRQFINYDANKYIIYTRLLSSYQLLDKGDIEKYYARIQDLVNTDTRARNTWEKRPEAGVYYAMANKDYNKAVELLPRMIENSTDSWGRRRYLRMMINASRELGRNDLLLPAMTEYSALTDELLKQHISSIYREMQIAYDMYDLEDEFQSLKNEKADSERKLNRNLMILVIITTIALIAMIVILFVVYRRTRTLARRLEESNNTLTSERDQLRVQQDALKMAREEAEKANALRAHFIKNLSSEIVPPLNSITEYAHLLTDLIDESTKQYMESYVGMIDLNCDLLRTLSQDVMLLSEIDTTRLPINNTNVDVERTLRTAIDAAKGLDRKGLEMNFVNDGIDFMIHSDPQRIQQIITYLLSNAFKFTDEGSVTVRAYKSGKNLAISVTDTGIGVNHKFKDKIFDRFFKVSRDTPGAGLGLHIARHLARLLGGE